MQKNERVYIQTNKFEIVLLEDFKDTLQIWFNRKLIKRDFFITNPSTGACDNIISINLQAKSNTLLLKSKNEGSLSIQIPIRKKRKFLYVRKNARRWSYEYLDKALMLE
jgi:hypothetical protein